MASQMTNNPENLPIGAVRMVDLVTTTKQVGSYLTCPLDRGTTRTASVLNCFSYVVEAPIRTVPVSIS